MVQPLAWVPDTVHGVGVVRAGCEPQMSITLPLTEPPAEALLSKTLPFDQMSPVTYVLEEPWNVSDWPPLPPQPAGANVWMAAPLVPALRATAVAAAEALIDCPEPSTCMIATGIEGVAVSAKLTPASALLMTASVKVCHHGRPS